MAPEAARRKPKENNYLFNVGVQGRKTGITVPDAGIRDENGLEPLDHLFSSPEKAKSIQRPNGNNGNAIADGTITSEEDMDVDDSTIPDPAAVLNERKKNMRMPPPRSKSPIKTFLQSPARRNPSLGPASSPERPREKSISAPVRRKLDFANDSFQSLDGSTSIQAPQKRAGSASAPGMAKLSKTDASKVLGPLLKNVNNAVLESDNDDSAMTNGGLANEDDSMQLINDDSVMMTGAVEVEEVSELVIEEEVAVDEQEESEPEPLPVPNASKKGKGKATEVEEVTAKAAAPKRGRPKKAANTDIYQIPEEKEEPPVELPRPQKRTRSSLDGSASKLKSSKAALTVDAETEDAEVRPAKKKGGRPPKVAEEAEEPVEKKKGRPKKTQIQELETEEAEQSAPKSKGGRSKKIVKPIQEEESELPLFVEQEEVEERPWKKVRRSVEDAGPSKVAEKPKKAAKPAPAKSKAKSKSKLDSIPEAESPALQRGPPLPKTNHGLFILRRETPGAAANIQRTRSGRNSIKPVAYWKNERIEYDEEEMADNYGKYVMPSIKEVIRKEEIDPWVQKRYNKRSKSKGPSRSRKATREPESEDDDEIEPWEMEPGNVFATVRAWDPEDQTGAQAEDVEDEVALSSAAIVTRDIAGASFKFAKTLSLPFFGAGMVDLPPNSIKKPKNSRRMQMAFFVFTGRVKVTINDTEFRISKGGMFNVPRGNFYSIENDYEKPARIFFAQGCEVIEEVAESQ